MALPEYNNITVLYHAQAGSGTGGKVAPQVVEGVKRHFTSAHVEVVETQGKEQIQGVGASSSSDLIICLAGDGSVHDVAQTIIGRPEGDRPTLAVIPAGSGNDYARTLGMPLDPLKALAILPDCLPIKVDVGRVNSTYFLQTLSFGVDAAVAINTEDLRRSTKTRGLRLYARAAVSAILKELQPHHVQVRTGTDDFMIDALILTIQNGPTYGSGFKVAPRARITDGELDVYIASGIGKLKALYYLSQIKTGKHEKLKGFSHFRATNLNLHFEEQVPIQCDGEHLLGLEFAIDVVPKALDVLVSPVSKEYPLSTQVQV